MRDIDNEPLVRLIGQGHVTTLVSHDIIGRLMIMFMRQPGLSKVYRHVLGFTGNEFYFQQWDQVGPGAGTQAVRSIATPPRPRRVSVPALPLRSWWASSIWT